MARGAELRPGPVLYALGPAPESVISGSDTDDVVYSATVRTDTSRRAACIAAAKIPVGDSGDAPNAPVLAALVDVNAQRRDGATIRAASKVDARLARNVSPPIAPRGNPYGP
jgi:hypothetical protein